MTTTAFKQVADSATSTTSTNLSSPGVTSISVASGDGSRFPAPGNGFYLTLWNGTSPRVDSNAETVVASALSGDTITISATAKAHASPCNVGLLDSAGNILDIQHAVNAVEASMNATSVTGYGAKVDGVILYDVVTSATNPLVSSSSATFTGADVGKVIVLHRVGSAGSELVTSIAAVVSATSVQLAAAPTVTATGVMTVYGTDDTAAYQSAINAVNSVVVGNAKITVPAGVSIVNGPQLSGTSGGGTYSGQILFPARVHDGSIQSFNIIGASANAGPDTTGPQANTSEFPPSNGTIIFSTAATGAVFDCIPAASGTLVGAFTFINASFQNLIVRCLPATSTTPLSLAKANSAQVKDVIVDTFSILTETVAWGSGNSTGIWLPAINNSANVLAENCWVSGFKYGLRHSECTHLDNVSIYLCSIAIGVQAGYHDATYSRVTLSQNVTNIQVPGISVQPVTPIRGFVDIEHAVTGKPYTNVYDVDDSHNLLRGHLWVHLVQGSVGVSHDIHLNGGAGLHVVEEFASIAAGELLGQTVYNPSTAATVTATSALTAIDSANAVVSFIAPPNRNVLVETSLVVTMGASNSQLNVGLLESSIPVGSQSEMRSVATASGSSDQRVTGHLYASGLAAGTHTFSLAIVGSGTASASYGGPSSLASYGALVIKVFAA